MSATTDAEIDAAPTPFVLATTDTVEIKDYAGGYVVCCGEAFTDWVRVDLATGHVVRGAYRHPCTTDAGLSDAGPNGYPTCDTGNGTTKTTDAEVDITSAQVADLIAIATKIQVTRPECVCCDGEGFTATVTRRDGSSAVFHTGLDYDICATASIVSDLSTLYRAIVRFTY